MIFQTMAPPSVIWQIIGVSILFSVFSKWFSTKFGLTYEEQMENQTKMKDIKQKMQEAAGDSQLLFKIQQEMMVLIKNTYKKQLIPMLIRSLIWFGVLGLLNLLYGEPDTDYLSFNFLFGKGIFNLFILVSLLFSILTLLIKKLLIRMNPEKFDKEKPEKIAMLENDVNVINPTIANDTQFSQDNEIGLRFERNSNKNWKNKI